MRQTSYRFESHVLEFVEDPLPGFTDDEIKNEPMLYSCDYATTRKLGGPITHAFLDKVLPTVRSNPSFIFDSRSHMLMPGMFPCIPGYHHDDVPRTAPGGQPNYDNPAYDAGHVMAIVGDASKTEFAVGTADFPAVPEGQRVYEFWHEEVMKKLAAGELKMTEAKPGHIIYFNSRTWHRGTAATKHGWRWFGRASYNTQRRCVNEQRMQVQVYLPVVNAGW